MSPLILIGIYAFLSVLAGVMTERCLRLWRPTAGRAARLRRVWLPLYILLSLVPVAGAFLPDGPLRFALQAAGNIWLGFYLYYGWFLIMLMIPAEIVRRVRGGRGGALHGAALCLSLAVSSCFVGYGLVHAQRTVVTRQEVAIRKSAGDPAAEQKEMRLALVGDFHLGVNSKLPTTRRMVELINAEEPDAVLIAGDVFTSSYRGLKNPAPYAEALRGIRAKYGVYAVYGNHDVEETLFGGFPVSPVSEAFRTPEMEAFFRDSGFTVLADEGTLLGEDVQLYGRLDLDKSGDGTSDHLAPAELLASADPEKPILILQHEPKDFRALAEAGADLALCGHTHNGQIFPGNLVIPFFNENAYGYVFVDGLHTLVTAGVGYYGPPLRIGTDSEVMIVTLRY